MNILYLSFYFPPDLCAGSFRNGPLVDALKSKLPVGAKIEVLTTLPNRYSGYSVDAPEDETNGNLTIRRVRLPSHKSGMLDQARAFLTYTFFVRRVAREGCYDLIFVSSSRLMTAVLGAGLARQRQVPLYLDIRDIFVDTIKDVLPQKIACVMVPLFGLVERWTFNVASRINVVSEGFLPYFDERYPAIPKAVFTNGIDEAFLQCVDGKSVQASLGQDHVKNDTLLEILYAGNIGEGQGLENIIPALATRLEGKAKIRIIGAGGKISQLESRLIELSCSNVIIQQPVARDKLLDYYCAADILFLHLNNYNAFLKVLPSKVFEYGATGKPILAGVGGYAKTFIENNVSNAEVFSPCDVNAAVVALSKLEIKTKSRDEFVSQYKRNSIMTEMADDIMNTWRERH